LTLSSQFARLSTNQRKSLTGCCTTSLGRKARSRRRATWKFPYSRRRINRVARLRRTYVREVTSIGPRHHRQRSSVYWFQSIAELIYLLFQTKQFRCSLRTFPRMHASCDIGRHGWYKTENVLLKNTIKSEDKSDAPTIVNTHFSSRNVQVLKPRTRTLSPKENVNSHHDNAFLPLLTHGALTARAIQAKRPVHYDESRARTS